MSEGSVATGDTASGHHKLMLSGPDYNEGRDAVARRRRILARDDERSVDRRPGEVGEESVLVVRLSPGGSLN